MCLNCHRPINLTSHKHANSHNGVHKHLNTMPTTEAEKVRFHYPVNFTGNITIVFKNDDTVVDVPAADIKKLMATYIRMKRHRQIESLTDEGIFN